MPKNRRRKGRGLRRFIRILIVLVIVLGLFVVYFSWDTNLEPPDVAEKTLLIQQRLNPSSNFYKFNNNILQQNEDGLWEMYLEGKPFEMGVANGKLTKELIKIQEDAFVDRSNLVKDNVVFRSTFSNRLIIHL